MKRILSPSILSADFSRLAEEVSLLEDMGIEEIHLDVMDGHFVPNITIGPPVIKSLRKETDLFFDAHLMITHPARYFDRFIDAGADGITCHVEVEESKKCLDMAVKEGIRAGISLNPETPLEKVLPFVEKADMVLVMTVHPGFGGQRFIREMIPKISALRDYIEKNGLDTRIQVDGGINTETAEDVLKAGAEILVSGSGVFKGDVRKNIERLKGIIEGFEK